MTVKPLNDGYEVWHEGKQFFITREDFSNPEKMVPIFNQIHKLSFDAGYRSGESTEALYPRSQSWT